MANLRTAGFRKVIPTLKASDLRGQDGTVITIQSADVIPNPSQGKNQRKQLLEVRMTEWPDKVYYPNQTGITALMERLGDETTAWVGAQVPLIVEAANNPQSDEEVMALHVAPVSKWDEILAEVNGEIETTKPRRRRAK